MLSLVGTVMAPCLVQSAIKLPDYLRNSQGESAPVMNVRERYRQTIGWR